MPRDGVADRAPTPTTASLLDIDAKYGDVISIDEAIARRDGASRRPSSDGTATTFAFDAPRSCSARARRPRRASTSRQLGVTRALVVCDRFVDRVRARASGSRRRSRAAGVELGRLRPHRRRAERGVRRGGGRGGARAASTASSASAAARRSTRPSSARCFATHGGELLDYVNAPIGGGAPVPGPVLPIVALPTTSGTGSEVTTVAVVDFPRLGTKTGVSHQHLRPALAIVDPLLTRVVPAGRHRRDRHRRADARARGVHVSCRTTRAPTLPLARAAAVPGREPVRRPALRARDRARRPQPPHGRRGRRRRRGAHGDGARLDDRRHRVLGRRRPRPARARLSDRLAAARVDAAGLRRRGASSRTASRSRVTAPAVFRFIADACPERCATAARLLDGGDDLAGVARAPDGGRRRADAPARDRLRRGRPRGDRPRRARPAAAARRRAEGGRRGRARGAAARRRCERRGAWPRGSPSSAPGRWASASRTSSPSSGIPTVARRRDARAVRGGARARRRAARPARAGGNVDGGTTATAERTSRRPPSIADAVGDADLVVEAVVERPDVEARGLRGDRGGCRGDAVIATNTSSIPIAELAAGLRAPGALPRRPLVRPAAARPVRRGDPGAGDRRSRSSSAWSRR